MSRVATQVGTIRLTGQATSLDGTPGQRLGVCTAEPGTPDHDAMILLDMITPGPASRSADLHQEQSHEQA
ncbi:hypothetical protein [Streptomyces sp. NPDC101165]|uniref:hypothetical protein n=1 Tax=Streptomyces sp. NPDC101165 TaxID=3366119 RepID=UPI0038073B3A